MQFYMCVLRNKYHCVQWSLLSGVFRTVASEPTHSLKAVAHSTLQYSNFGLCLPALDRKCFVGIKDLRKTLLVMLSIYNQKGQMEFTGTANED